MSTAITLNGRRVLITGSGQGVGRGLAHAFGAAGADVLVNDLRTERAQEVVDEIREAGGTALAVPFDVTDYESVTSAVGQAGSIDILVNNAGNAGTEDSGREIGSPTPNPPTGRRSCASTSTACCTAPGPSCRRWCRAGGAAS